MIGDRERPDDGRDEPVREQFEEYGPIDAAVRLDPPPPDSALDLRMVPAWVERYGRYVIVRHVFPDCEEQLTETLYGSEAHSLRGMARQVATLIARGYRPLPDDHP